MLLRGRAAAKDDRLASLEASIRLSLDSPRMTDAGRRLYAMLGRLPDGLALGDAGALLLGEGDDAAVRLLGRGGAAGGG